MKGYTPNYQCKKQIEASSKTGQFIMELGMKQEAQCNCENGKCEYNKGLRIER